MRLTLVIACLLLPLMAVLANAADNPSKPPKHPEKEWCNAHDWPKACKHTPME
jgi:hypothetical protein